MTTEKEIWKPIKGYEGVYEVSNFGRVRSLDRLVTNTKGVSQRYKGRILKPQKDKDGYLYVELNKCGDSKKFRIHQIVAKCFIPNPNNFPQINHKDENPLNNHVSNIEWCHQQYNNTYGNRISKMLKTYKSNGYSRPVIQFDTKGNYIKEYTFLSDTKKDGFNLHCVYQCCIFKITNHKRFIWLYKEDADKIEYAVKRYKERSKTTRVNVFTVNGDFLGHFNSLKEAALAFNCKYSKAKDCLSPKGHTKQCNGYVFKYAE